MLRIMSATVQYLITETNEQGDPTAEYLSQPIRVFRAIHPDIWLHGDLQAFPLDAPTDALGRKMGTMKPNGELKPADAV